MRGRRLQTAVHGSLVKPAIRPVLLPTPTVTGRMGSPPLRDRDPVTLGPGVCWRRWSSSRAGDRRPLARDTSRPHRLP